MVKALDTEKLYRTYFMQVYSYVMNIVKNPAAAEEITQNTFMKTLTAKNGYKGASSEYTWLCAIAKNQCYDYFRKNGKVADGIEAEEQKTDDRDVTEDFIVRESSLAIAAVLFVIGLIRKKVRLRESKPKVMHCYLTRVYV